MTLEVSSWKRDRSWGMMDTGVLKNSEGKVYSRSGSVVDPVLGIVNARVSAWRTNGNLTYTADCGFHGMNIDVREERAGTLSNRSLARWVWKHAIPAMKAHAMEVATK